MRARRVVTPVIVFALISSNSGAADELADLARLHREIGYVVSLVETVRMRSVPVPDAPVRFRYDALRARLEAIQEDIARHIDFEQRRPKPERFRVPPVR